MSEVHLYGETFDYTTLSETIYALSTEAALENSQTCVPRTTKIDTLLMIQG